MRSLQNASESKINNGSSSNSEFSANDKKTVETAKKFEALLIHSMLKSMRKTTMAENTTNQRAMYDDMLDKQLADTMVEAGGLGVVEQLLTQLDPNRTQGEPKPLDTTDRQKLRELVSGSEKPLSVSTPDNPSTTNISKLAMASGLWSSEIPSDRKDFRHEFTEPLKYHAHRSAERLGTSPNAILAIAALETGWGRSLPTDSQGTTTNNYFGIKASSNDTRYAENLTKEFIDGDLKTIRAKFKSYDSVADSVSGFADFIIDNPRYSKAIEHAGDPERFLTELHKAGYATDPRYAEKAISILHQINKQSAQL
ncbi:MAG: flagellar assembly peptidoglycan hydrolase FlgJ [Granulosicoccus sp.]